MNDLFNPWETTHTNKSRAEMDRLLEQKRLVDMETGCARQTNSLHDVELLVKAKTGGAMEWYGKWLDNNGRPLFLVSGQTYVPFPEEPTELEARPFSFLFMVEPARQPVA